MALPLWPLLVFADLASAAGTPTNLDVAALASPRPQVCRGSAQRVATGVWERVRGAERERYCNLLARGYARLASAPEQARAAAESARQIAGATSAVLVLEGRAALRLGEPQPAREAFVRAEADASAFLDLGALRDYARVSATARDTQRAARLYRMLASRAGLVEAQMRSVIYVEAAAQVLAADRAGTEEALAYLGQVGEGRAGLSDWVLALSALCLDRADHADRAAALLAGRPLAEELRVSTSEDAPLLPAGELAALNALWLERSDPARARQLWDEFLAQAPSDGPWLEHARKKRDRLAGARKGKP